MPSKEKGSDAQFSEAARQNIKDRLAAELRRLFDEQARVEAIDLSQRRSPEP
jgi:hypothetical protein